MSLVPYLNPLAFGVGAFLSSFAAYLVATSLRARSGSGLIPTARDISDDALVFLIRNHELVDSNFAGERFLQQFPMAPSGIARLKAALKTQFEDVEALIALHRPPSDKFAVSRDGALNLVSEMTPEAIRITVTPSDPDADGLDDIHRRAATEAELETLRQSTEHSPFLVWREAADGTPVWVNRGYADAVAGTFGKERLLSWPLPRLFPDLKRDGNQRLSLTSARSDTLTWFDCHATAIGTDTLFTAFDASATVQAETQLRDFMQVLTQTFAQLDIGLAIFDKSRRLVLFNPALTDLTRLPVDFLSARPGLSSFLDKLRELRMLPEPKDYKSWRQSIADLESAAADGTFSDTWVLPGNQTFRVTGRPHPVGAIALLLEDISAEMSLTRRFRAELETGQAALDNLDDAIAVFSLTGAMMMSNCAYRELFHDDPEVRLTECGVVDAVRRWHDASVPTPVWGDVRDFVLQPTERVEWTADVALKDGRNLACRIVPLPDGATQMILRIGRAAAVQDTELLQAM